ncbi:hypothetical protein CPLU01_06313 [Colletotrichum plurivorum]|uniref:Uncharacterized protein n=1 Tax=Colletotrichum plurivorum TaxID=2175906 RepID=A0A8H6KIP0_9PEZI|nr:hypothetical protein CPLU01_06313 [Colletotrichum plurivorum]
MDLGMEQANKQGRNGRTSATTQEGATGRVGLRSTRDIKAGATAQIPSGVDLRVLDRLFLNTRPSRPTFKYSYLIHIPIIVIASLEFILVTDLQLRYPRTKDRRRPSPRPGLPCVALRIVLAATTLLAQPLTTTRLARSQNSPQLYANRTRTDIARKTHISKAKEGSPAAYRNPGTVTACTTATAWLACLLQGQPPFIGYSSLLSRSLEKRRVQLAIAGPSFPHGTTAIKPSSCPRCVTSRQSPSSKDPSQFLFEPSP